ncbi:MAG: HAD family hydrolase [Gammaproteobacteria bacterium]|nr:MAG: HAD family hydrolase [Gammaproteobacteria bacterium]
MSTLKAILWDVDGTLADTERDGHRVAFNIAFEEAGLNRRWDVSTYGELLKVTGGKERIRYDIQRGDMPEMSNEQIARLHARKTQAYQELIAEGRIPLRPGVRRLLEEAFSAGITLGIATTTTPAALNALIEHSLGPEWFERFAVMAAGDIVPSKKPAPDIYLHAMEQLGLSPKETLAMEDSENGLLSAKNAGLRCIVTVNDYTQNHDFKEADLVISTLGDPEQPCTALKNPHNLQGLEYITLQHCQSLFVKM